jgi:glutaredoxin-related protein
VGAMGVRWHVWLVHAHVRQRLPEHQTWPFLRLLYVPSAIISFASLDICISPVEYDVTFVYGKYNVKE